MRKSNWIVSSRMGIFHKTAWKPPPPAINLYHLCRQNQRTNHQQVQNRVVTFQGSEINFESISSHLREIYIETTSRFPLPPTVMKLENRTMEVDFCFEDDCFSTDSRLWTEEYLTLDSTTTSFREERRQILPEWCNHDGRLLNAICYRS